MIRRGHLHSCNFSIQFQPLQCHIWLFHTNWEQRNTHLWRVEYKKWTINNSTYKFFSIVNWNLLFHCPFYVLRIVTCIYLSKICFDHISLLTELKWQTGTSLLSQIFRWSNWKSTGSKYVSFKDYVLSLMHSYINEYTGSKTEVCM